MLPNSANPALSGATAAVAGAACASSAGVDYTNPAHAATLAVMMQHAAKLSRSASDAAAAAGNGDSSSSSCPNHNGNKHRIVRRSSLASSTPAPRRSSLRRSSISSVDDGNGSDGDGSGRRPQRRRSSVTFKPDIQETRTVAKLCSNIDDDDSDGGDGDNCQDNLVRREALYYGAEDYSQFRREHIREKRAEARERAALMTRWRTTFGSGPKKAQSSARTSASSPDSPSSSKNRVSKKFASNFRRSVGQQGAVAVVAAQAGMGGLVGPKPAVRTARLA